jgi:hypothetical protein
MSRPACRVVKSSVGFWQTGQQNDTGRVTIRCRSMVVISILLFIIVSRTCSCIIAGVYLGFCLTPTSTNSSKPRDANLEKNRKTSGNSSFSRFE